MNDFEIFISWHFVKGKMAPCSTRVAVPGRVSAKKDISHGINNSEIIMKVGMPIRIEILLKHKYLMYIHLYVIGSHYLLFFFPFLSFHFYKGFFV